MKISLQPIYVNIIIIKNVCHIFHLYRIPSFMLYLLYIEIEYYKCTAETTFTLFFSLSVLQSEIMLFLFLYVYPIIIINPFFFQFIYTCCIEYNIFQIAKSYICFVHADTHTTFTLSFRFHYLRVKLCCFFYYMYTLS